MYQSLVYDYILNAGWAQLRPSTSFDKVELRGSLIAQKIAKIETQLQREKYSEIRVCCSEGAIHKTLF